LAHGGVLYQDNERNGKSILDLTTLAAECGTRLDLEACGPDAVAAVEALAVLVAARFYENENEREHSSMMSNPSQIIVTNEDYRFHSVHALSVHHRDFPRSGAKAARLRMPPQPGRTAVTEPRPVGLADARAGADETAGDGMNGITEGDIVSLTSDSRRWRVLAIFIDRALIEIVGEAWVRQRTERLEGLHLRARKIIIVTNDARCVTLSVWAQPKNSSRNTAGVTTAFRLASDGACTGVSML
jgi:PTS HPr component phosphorylation site